MEESNPSIIPKCSTNEVEISHSIKAAMSVESAQNDYHHASQTMCLYK